MTNIRRKILSAAVILLGMLIITPSLYAQSPNNNRGRHQRERNSWQQNAPMRQRPAIRARQVARQNWWLRFVNQMQRIKIWRLHNQIQQNRFARRWAYRRHFARNRYNYNNNYNNNHWERP